MNPLLKLLADNRGRGVFRVDNKSGDEATVYLYGAIVSDNYWGDGIAAIDFVKALAGLDVKTIHLRIDSPGGEVFAGQSMAQAIREHASTVIAHIDGLAASAASWVALAADQVVISQGGMVMIHQAQGIAVGNAADLRGTADLLEKVDGILVAGYVAETGQTEQQITDWMAAETWFSAEEAVANGFADSIAIGAGSSNQGKGWNLAAYSHAPAQPPAAAAVPDPVAPSKAETKPPTFVKNTEDLRRALRLKQTESA